MANRKLKGTRIRLYRLIARFLGPEIVEKIIRTR